MYADAREVVPEARLHVFAHVAIELTSGRAQSTVHGGRDRTRDIRCPFHLRNIVSRGPRPHFTIFPATQAHHAFSNRIGLPLVDIAGCADGEFRLHPGRGAVVHGNPGKVPEQWTLESLRALPRGGLWRSGSL